METQCDDGDWEMGEVEFLAMDRMIGGLDAKKATVNTDILYNEALMQINEQDVPCTSPVRNEGAGSVPEVYGVRNSDDEYNANITGYNNQGGFQNQMQQIANENPQPDFYNLAPYNYQPQPQGECINPQQYNTNFNCYAEPQLHQHGYPENECYYDATLPEQQSYDVSAYGAPVDPNNYQQADVYSPYEEQTLAPVQLNQQLDAYQQYEEQILAHVQPTQQLDAYQQYEEQILAHVQPTQQLDVSSLELNWDAHAPARYRNRSGPSTRATPSRRQPSRPIRIQIDDEELMVPDIIEEQSGCGRRGRGKAGTKQNSVQRHRQSIKDFLCSAPKNIENLEKMRLAVAQANKELDRMIYVLQGMSDYVMVPELGY